MMFLPINVYFFCFLGFKNNEPLKLNNSDQVYIVKFVIFTLLYCHAWLLREYFVYTLYSWGLFWMDFRKDIKGVGVWDYEGLLQVIFQAMSFLRKY